MAIILSALLAGFLFGMGILVSGMVNPAKVLNFFDLAGSFDPSLAFVMGGAVLVTSIGYRLVFRRSAPLFDKSFHLPTAKDIDLKLVGGAAIFGVGWGIAGFCPGGAVPALGYLRVEPVVFVVALLVGMKVTRAIVERGPPKISRAPNVDSATASPT